MKCLDVVKEDMLEVGGREDEVLDVVMEDMQEVGVREDEVFGCGEGGHAGGRKRGKMECLTEVYGEHAVVTNDGKAERRKRIDTATSK